MGLLDRIQAIVLAGTGALGELERQKVLNDLADPRSPRTDRYRTYESYYDGETTAKLTGRLKAYLEVNGFGYVENFCETIVDALATTLQLNDVAGESDGFSEWVTELWKANDLDDLQGVVHTQTPMKGDAFLIVDWNDETQLPRFTFNRPELIRPIYDAHGVMLVAAKSWEEAKVAPTNPSAIPIRRLNLYFAGRVEKWFTTTGIDPREAVQHAIWAPHMDPSDTVWPLAWLDRQGDPLGIAVLHFRNKPKGRNFGRSELHSVIPQQNYLMKQLVDLAETLDYQGAAQRWGTGVKEGTWTAAPGTVWTTENENARFGQFDPSNPTGVLEAIEQTLRRMAARSQTPLHQLMTGGNQPSGETLKAAREPLVAKAEDRQTSYGGTWVRAHVLALKLMGLHVPSFAVPPDLALEAAWESAETADEKGELEAAEIKSRLGVSKWTLLQELGYDPEQEGARRADEAAAAAEQQAKLFPPAPDQDPAEGATGGPGGPPRPGGPVPPPAAGA